MSSPQRHGTTSAALARGDGLVTLGVLALIGLSAWFWFTSRWQDPMLNLLAIGICVFGVAPMLRWLYRHEQYYPLPELLQLTMVPFYAVPIFSEHADVMEYNESVLTKAVLLVVVFQGAVLLGSFFSGRSFRRARQRPFLQMQFVREDRLGLTLYTTALTTLWLLIANFTDLVAGEYFGTFRAIFFGVGTISNFVLARMWGAGQLNPSQKAVFSANLVLQVLLHSQGLLLITGITTSLLTLVGYFSSARRVPVIVCLVGVAVFGVLHNGKYEMRKIYWEEQSSRKVTLLDLPGYYAEWFGHGFATVQADEEARGGQSNANIFQRASLMQIVSYVVATVPVSTPYLEGATYAVIPSQIFPRFLWPDKPSPNDSVKILSVRLGVLTEEQAETTSIGYGLIAESYVNFGFYSTGLIGLIIGWLLRRIALVTGDCSALSLGGIFRILCLAWCLNTETTLAVWLSSFYQACIAVFVPLLVWKKLTSG